MTEHKKKTTNVTKISMWQNLECDKTQNSTFENSKTQKSEEEKKTQNVIKFKNLKYDRTQRLKMWRKKTQKI